MCCLPPDNQRSLTRSFLFRVTINKKKNHSMKRFYWGSAWQIKFSKSNSCSFFFNKSLSAVVFTVRKGLHIWIKTQYIWFWALRKETSSCVCLVGWYWTVQYTQMAIASLYWKHSEIVLSGVNVDVLLSFYQMVCVGKKASHNSIWMHASLHTFQQHCSC